MKTHLSKVRRIIVCQIPFKEHSHSFDSLNNELLIAKLHACGFDVSLLKQLYGYLSNR